MVQGLGLYRVQRGTTLMFFKTVLRESVSSVKLSVHAKLDALKSCLSGELGL